MRSHIGWIGERNIPYKGVETSASGGLELIQSVFEVRHCKCSIYSVVGCYGLVTESRYSNPHRVFSSVNIC